VTLTVGALVDGLRQRAARLPSSLPLRLPARHANVVQSLPLGPGSRLLVVEFGGKRLLVGQSRAGLSLLGETAE
jgi:flagellar biogenesis protein FliO